MAERSEQRTRSADDAVEASPEESALDLDDEAVTGTDTAGLSSPDTGARSRGSRLRAAVRAPVGAVASRLTAPVEGLFSIRAFLVLAAVTVGGMLLVGAVLPFGAVGGLLGVAAAAFGAGLVGERRRYLEVTLAGALASGLSWVLGNLVLTALGPGVPLVAVGVGFGAVAALVGHYFGRDLREGLTRDL